VRAALSHQEPDRVPLDLAGTMSSGINFRAYEELLRYLGLDEAWSWDLERSRTVNLSETVRRRLHVDIVNVRPGGPLPRRWSEGGLAYEQDHWGVTWVSAPGGHYYVAQPILAGASSLADLDTVHWPDPTNPTYDEGLPDRIGAAQALGDYGICLSLPVGFIHQSQFLRGYEEWLADLLVNRRFAEALLDRVLEIKIEKYSRILDAAGADIDVVIVGDDIGFQNGPMVSPALYRRMIAPRQRRLFATLHAHSAAAVLYHTCGSIVQMIPDLIDMGVDAINPVQVSAAGMDTAWLKREFGRQLCFWGGIDSHQVLPYGTQEDVRAEVRRRIDDLAGGGGYVVAATHHIQHGVPPANVLTLFDEAAHYGWRDRDGVKTGRR